MSRRTYSLSTGEDIINEHLAFIGDDVDTSIDPLQETSLLFTLNRLQRAVANLPFARLKVGSDYIMPTGRPWDFLTEEKEYSIIDNTTLAAALAAGETTSIAITDGTGWDDTSGAFLSYDGEGTWDYITFATRTSGTLTTLTDVGLGNDSGDEVNKLYKLPSDFWQPISLHVPDVSSKPYTEVDLNPGAQEYAIINGFLWMYKDHEATTATLKYQKTVTDLAIVTSSMTTPKELDLYFVEMLNARAYRFNGNPQADIDRAHNEAKSHLLNALDLCTVASDRGIKTVRGPFRSPTA